MNVFISGGCKNGKSYYAQRMAKAMADKSGKPLYYIATMIPHDDEDRARIKRHLSEREGWGFETIEQGKNITAIFDDDNIDKSGVFLLDSVTALLENEMFERDGRMDSEAPRRVKDQLVDFAEITGNTVFVSDYIYSDAFIYSETVEMYRKSLAGIDRALACVCDTVTEISAGGKEHWK